MKLYEITGALVTLLDYYSSQDCENDEATLEGIQQMELKRDEKLEACIATYKNMGAVREMIANEIKKLKAKLDSQEKRINNLKNYISNNMLPGEKWKSDNGLHSLSWRATKSIEVLDESLLSTDLFRVKLEPDKGKIKELIESGEAIKGAVLVHSNNLQIK